MGYKLPDFHITINVWTNGEQSPTPPRLTLAAQFKAPGKRSTGQLATSAGWPFLWTIEVPARTDIRDENSISGPDTIECPAGTGRYYKVVLADDVARDYPNEYRQIIVRKGGTWPTPMP